MRVLYVNHTSRISGGEHSLMGLLGSLPAKVEATVACPEGELANRLRERDIEVRPVQGTDGSLRLHPTETPRALLDLGRAALQVRRHATEVGADVIHANSIRGGIIATQACRALPQPTVVHVRDCLPPGRLSALSLRAIAGAEAIVANSDYTRAALGPSRKRAVVIHNAVDVERFDRVPLDRAQARKRLGLGDADPVIAVVAQITPWKGQLEAIEVASALRGRFPDLRLLLVGSAKFTSRSTRYDNLSYLDELQHRVADSGLAGTVQFLDERDDVPEVLRSLDLLLVPSWEEPFGRTIVEAMAAGVPVAATDVGGPPEILGDEGCGILLPPRDPQLWAEEVAVLLSDRERLASMGQRGKDAARHRFGIDRHVTEILGVYEKVLEAPVAA